MPSGLPSCVGAPLGMAIHCDERAMTKADAQVRIGAPAGVHAAAPATAQHGNSAYQNRALTERRSERGLRASYSQDWPG
eukprot:363316-Chlamydomonas_euryale.AAC.15